MLSRGVMARFGVTAVAALVLACGTLGDAGEASATANLVQNGGFETPNVGTGYTLFNAGSSFTGWNVVGSGNVAVVSGKFAQNGFTFPAKSGAQWLDLTGVSNSAAGVSQTVATKSGKTYTLKFSVGNVYNPTGIFGVKSTVEVLVNGTKVFAAVNSKGKGKTKQVWKTFSLKVTAVSSSTSIEFLNGDPSNDTNNGLDAVSLT